MTTADLITALLAQKALTPERASELVAHDLDVRTLEALFDAGATVDQLFLLDAIAAEDGRTDFGEDGAKRYRLYLKKWSLREIRGASPLVPPYLARAMYVGLLATRISPSDATNPVRRSRNARAALSECSSEPNARPSSSGKGGPPSYMSGSNWRTMTTPRRTSTCMTAFTFQNTETASP